VSEVNDRMIAEFRANRGRVVSAGFGSSLVLIHSTGSQTGLPRVTPAMSLHDDNAWLVVGSAMGAAKDPAWAVNLRAHPRAVIEAATGDGIATMAVDSMELDGAEYQAAFARFVARAPAFAAYQERAARRLPVIRLTPVPEATPERNTP
jgi:deazaflavin-dependent oxidoreductase (nitroreductase family)